MKTITTGIAIIMAVVAISCHQSNKETSATDAATIQNVELQDQKAGEPVNEKLQTTGVVADSTVLQAGQPAVQPDWDRKIIKTANVKLEVKDFNNYNKKIHQDVRRYGGYVAGEQQNQTDGIIENVITIKVPVAQFEEMMEVLPGDGNKLLEKNINTEDVTAEVVDTKSRVETKKQVRDKYYDFLKQAKNMKEVLEVQNEINQLQESIEAGTGRVQMLTKQAAFSTINLTYFQYLSNQPSTGNERGFFSRLSDAFYNGASIITGFVLLLITFWPIVLVVGVVLYLRRAYIKQLVKK